MDVDKYRSTYFNFVIAVNQTRLISLTAGEVLDDFPNNLPLESRKGIIETFKGFHSMLGEALGSFDKPNDESSSVESEEASPEKLAEAPIVNAFALRALLIRISQSLSGKGESKLDFESYYMHKNW